MITTTEQKTLSIVGRCLRCGSTQQCSAWDGSIHLCELCIALIVREWRIHRDEFAELSTS